MIRIDFYHLTKSTLDEALPRLVTKAFQTDKTIKIKVGNPLRLDFLNTHLWTFDEESFLPHGTKKDGFSDMQPIFLSSDDEVPNDATLLFVVDGADVDPNTAKTFERIFYIFDSNNQDELSKARLSWKAFDADFEKHYWQQDATGKWQEKQI